MVQIDRRNQLDMKNGIKETFAQFVNIIENMENMENVAHISADRRAFNAWLALLDDLLERRMPIATAMVISGETLQEKQKEHGGALFNSIDLYLTCEDINTLLRRQPEYEQRSKGWAKPRKAKE
jgi:hypothetical protein